MWKLELRARNSQKSNEYINVILDAVYYTQIDIVKEVNKQKTIIIWKPVSINKQNIFWLQGENAF